MCLLFTRLLLASIAATMSAKRTTPFQPSHCFEYGLAITGRDLKRRRGRLCPHFERIKPAIYIDPVQLNTNKLLYGLCQTIDVFLPFHFCDYLTYGCETLFNTCVTTASMESSMM